MRRVSLREALVWAALALAGCAVDDPLTSTDSDASFEAFPSRCRICDQIALDPDSDGAPPCGDVVTSIVRETCVGGICHHAGNTPAAHLDLLSPCVADRLVGVGASCPGWLLVDPVDPERSFLLEKLQKDRPACGGVSMPFSNHLPPEELSCMRQWVHAIAARDGDGAGPARCGGAQ